MKRPRRAAGVPAVLALCALLAVACGSKSNSTSTGGAGPVPRPTSNVQLQIVSPTPDEVVTGSSTLLEVNLVGGSVVPPTQVSGPLRGDQGHIHVSVDGKLVTMAYTTSYEITGLTPGKHAVQAEFVAVDHLPFNPRVVNSVLFEVK